MEQPAPVVPDLRPSDAWLFGWDPTPGIVSVWATRRGRALVWQRAGATVHCTTATFRPWLFAASLEDLRPLGSAWIPEAAADSAAPFRYRLLDGAGGATYPYLLSARPGQDLEQAILTGAGARLDRPVRRLAELGEAYYGVGPVEQYLMQTGQVYFRGLAYSDLHRLQFDLETTALRPQEGRIFLVAVRDSRGLATVLEAPQPRDEAALIAALCALIRERDPDVLENHNLFGFDLPFLWARAQVLGVPLALGRAPGPLLLDRYAAPGGRRRARFSVAGRELIDTLDAVRRHDFTVRDLPSHGLKAVARYFGVAAPDRTYLAGSAIYATYHQDPATVRRYALDDVTEVDGLSRRLLGAPFALAGMAPRRYERVAAAGPATGILEPLLVRAYLRAGAALPRQSDTDAELGPHSGGAVQLFAGGVARHVVKADIASMYPSIMRVFRIGPACDRLGALLALVERLTDLRLEHKRLAQQATAGSEAAHEHAASQAAMKLLVNSAYGYMGAGSLALFADRAAADAVTRQGRAILEQVVTGLRTRGLALLEADTDGVFFAVPPDWSAAQERALVAEVAATLPAGLRLEYEGRYQAMLCHEVKNYALLTYEGTLILRGVAFRSRRAEPFGARFLEAAVRCLLSEDIAGMQAAYQATIQALRDRRLTVEEVATEARLAKPPATYLATRARLREAPYEALLGAGRRTWTVGERVRYYRSGLNQFVWLPPEEGETADTGDEAGGVVAEDTGRTAAPAEAAQAARPGYDVAHYMRVLHVSYVSRLRKAFTAEDFGQLFRADGQTGLFDRPLAAIRPRWIGPRAAHADSPPTYTDGEWSA